MPHTTDRIATVSVSFVRLPLSEPISDAKVLTGRQKPLVEVAFVFARIVTAADLRRVETVRGHLGDGVPMVVDANQQWDRATARRIGRALEQFQLAWIEEPLDAYDAEGHAALAASLDTPVATGEMLTGAEEHTRLIEAGAADFVQPDAPRVGGISPRSCG
ncbi:enolase C-terminal domain-like protein [Streptomyces decoyicus]|uniref:enolase C-terminal domain-like protein n=1 Tax=Streptomyces decoyicus TaxID=249567 RepID=UPI00363A747B